MGVKRKKKERREKRLQEIFHLRKQPISPHLRWWSSKTIAAVAGSSRGIGFEIARQLAAHGLFIVIAARDADRCRRAVEALRDADGLSNVDCHQLDISDSESVAEFGKWIVSNFGGLDILVNNAGVNYNIGSENSVEFAEKVMATNYFGTKQMIETMIPIMKPSSYGARILNVTSRLGRINGRRNRLGDATLRDQLSRDNCLTEELIDSMVVKFLEQVRLKTCAINEWPQVFTDYSLSKLAVNAYTRVMARVLSDRPEGQKIYVNCYCPGWVKTAMTNWEGNMSPEEGADTGVWAVLMPVKPVTGKFFAERREISF